MELYQIRYFLAVAETLNFTRASERAFISQPALTKAIQRLEEAIGGRLFDRTKSSVQLTELGRAMLPSFRQIFDAAQSTREQAKRLTREQKETVRVGVMCTIDFDLVLPGFSSCQDSQAAIELSFRDGNFEALTDALDRGDIDIGLMCSPYEIAKRFKTAPLFREDYVVAIGNDHRFNGRTEVALAELHREHYCVRTDCEFSHYIERQLLERGIELDVVQRSTREDWIQAFVRSNFGIAFMPESMAQAAQLAYVRTADRPFAREVDAMVQAERPLTAAQRAAIESLASYAWARSRSLRAVDATAPTDRDQLSGREE
ncbi:MAG: LysR family transcriptional regulator [Betaproteobacteria bacterium]|nr:MAG: LysR family transcriptional regulator [Betaproteobacteria bacterium]TMH28751.1 MAG: LysR family transcriptional regulator [Betaproteobacteria bacterium]